MLRSNVVAPILALAVVAGTSVYGYTSGALAADTKADTEQGVMIKVSDDGYMAMRAVRDARLAIFNGDPKAATAFVDTAETSLQAAEKEAPNYSVKTEVTAEGQKPSSTEESGKVEYIPIDAQIGLVDNFAVTPEKAEHIKKANEHFKAGESKQALAELKEGEVDVNYTRVIMPLTPTKKHVDEASKLLADHKYYEANLALKAAEDGIVLDTVSAVEPPATPKAG